MKNRGFYSKIEPLMERFKFLSKDKIADLPKNSGVYAFKNQGLLYIGKATNIKERVKNHFNGKCWWEKTLLRQGFGGRIGFIKTNSEIEALILEAKLIKKYQPRFNVMWRDSKNYFYIAISRDERPVVSITHQPSPKRIKNNELGIKNKKARIKKIKFLIPNSQFKYMGPFTDGTALKKTLRHLRRVFPYYSVKKHPKTLCLWCHLKLCPGPNPDLKEYRKSINNLVAFFKGEKSKIKKNLEKEMKIASRKRDFEKAAVIRDKISALEKTMENARIIAPESSKSDWQKTQSDLQKVLQIKKPLSRIEAYDVADIQGEEATASMIVFKQGGPDKSSYRKFKIKTVEKPNDVAMLEEAIFRRLRHPEWPYPEVILIDGGKGQLGAGQKAFAKSNRLDIALMALAKRNNELYIENKQDPVLLKSLPRGLFNLILQMRDEAHRFARVYHHKLRKIDFGFKK